MDGWTNDEVNGNPSVLPIYLGLFLALLAFFILFFSASLPDRNRRFEHSPGNLARLDPTPTTADPNIAALAAIADAFGRLGAPVPAHPEVPTEGLDVDLSARALFTAEVMTIRPGALAALDRIAIALATPRSETRLALDVAVGVGQSRTETATAIRRAAQLAEALLRRGAPPEAFTVSTIHWSADNVRIRLRLISNADDLPTAF